MISTASSLSSGIFSVVRKQQEAGRHRASVRRMATPYEVDGYVYLSFFGAIGR